MPVFLRVPRVPHPTHALASCLCFFALLSMSKFAAADHVARGAYPYAAEITIALSSQEKFYLMDRENSELFRETTTTRMAAYKIWGTGILATQNDPDDDDPHGPLKSLGLMVHEMGKNRGGTSTLSWVSDDVLRLEQKTTLIDRGGKEHPDVNLDINLEVVTVHGERAKRGSRMSLRLSPVGEQQFRTAIKAMVDSIMNDRRPEIETSLADNGLQIIPGTEKVSVNYPSGAELKIILDSNLGAARLRLPDMEIRLLTRVEQTFAEEESSNQR